MAWIDDTIWCVGCGVELTWSPVMVGRDRYCCQDCAQGLKCSCGVRMEIDEGDQVRTPITSGASAGHTD